MTQSLISHRDNILKAAKDLVEILEGYDLSEIVSDEQVKQDMVERIGTISNQGIQFIVKV